MSKHTRPSTELKHTKFVSALIENPCVEDAGRAAGVGKRQAIRLMQDERVQELLQEKFDEYALSADRVLREISLRAFNNIGNLLKFNEDGVPSYDLSHATREQLAAVVEVTVDETGGSGDGERAVRRVRIKMADQLKALEMLAKHLHLLDTRIELDVGDQLAERMVAARRRRVITEHAADGAAQGQDGSPQ